MYGAAEQQQQQQQQQQAHRIDTALQEGGQASSIAEPTAKREYPLRHRLANPHHASALLGAACCTC
jgi:hypothetical protein